MEKFSEAIVSFKKLLEIDSQNLDALISLGLCFSKLGKNEDALKLIDDALSIDPKNTSALYNKSLILGRLKDRKSVV